MVARHLHTALLLCAVSVYEAAARAASNQTLRSKLGAQAGATSLGYTSNSLCRQNNCINPIFPGLNDLPRLEALTWQCSTQTVVKDYMDFCKDAVIYDPALPSPTAGAQSVAAAVKAQDDAAMTMFIYHLSGMGYEAWDFQQPSQSDNDCVRSVWKMTCFTYFPRSNAGCQSGQMSLYQRPCQSSCTNYLAHCGVECCDESVQCAFTETKTAANGTVEILQTGYVDVDGPSAKCTGAARRSMAVPIFLLLSIFGIHWTAGASSASAQPQPTAKGGRRTAMWRWLPIAVLFAASAGSLQGCASGIPRHEVGAWRAKPNYLNTFKYLPPGANPRDAILNSCAQTGISATQQCSGRGYCKSFSTNSLVAQQNTGKPLSICSCDLGWADPECTTPRKSQTTAWFYSVFLGMFGADYFYLGYPLWGTGKLLTLGGMGFWWLIDIVRISSGPVYAYNFRTAADLPHWAAVLALVFACLFLGFLAAVESYLTSRKNKRADVAKLQQSEEDRHFSNTKAALMPAYGATWPDASSYAPQVGMHSYGPRPVPSPPVSGLRQGYEGQSGMMPPTSSFNGQPMVQQMGGFASY